MIVGAPRSEGELLERAASLAGRSLGEVAIEMGLNVPEVSTRAKGWAGTLLEQALGASAGSRPEPDFQLIGVELKSLPIDPEGRPKESTYVCNVPLKRNQDLSWENSNVHRKLKRVLWVPVLVAEDMAIAERVIGSAVLWSPTPHEESALRADWEELMDKVVMGETDTITAREGTWLQIRPKAADSRARSDGVDASGAPVRTLPRGFYLRTQFTQRILCTHYAIPGCYS